MKHVSTFLRNLAASGKVPALIMFAACGLCLGLAIIAIAKGDFIRVAFAMIAANLFVLGAYILGEIKR